NPSVGKPVGIPIAGEIMASRWAFEAFMVTQFKDNPFEENFYLLDQTAAEAEYKRVYYIPALESKLALVKTNRSYWLNPRHEETSNAITLLHSELSNELQYVGDDKLDISNLQPGRVDSLTLQNTSQFLEVLK